MQFSLARPSILTCSGSILFIAASLSLSILEAADLAGSRDYPNKAEIKPESKAALDEIAKLLKGEPNLKLHVVGHTDNVGGYEPNLGLSRRRAEAVVGALARNYGISAARLTPNGVAYLAPVAVNTTEEGRAKNRRVELIPQ